MAYIKLHYRDSEFPDFHFKTVSIFFFYSIRDAFLLLSPNAPIPLFKGKTVYLNFVKPCSWDGLKFPSNQIIPEDLLGEHKWTTMVTKRRAAKAKVQVQLCTEMQERLCTEMQERLCALTSHLSTQDAQRLKDLNSEFLSK